MKKFVLATAAFFVMVPAALADTDKEDGFERNQIVINLQTEGWVTTNTANVGVNFDIIQQAETALELKNQVMMSLEKLARNATWHITSSRENKDRTGLNRWQVTAEARVPEKSVAGLNDRAEDASRPGFNMRIGRVDFSPSLTETEKVRGELREWIYKEAAAEAARLTAAIPGSPYRVFVVDFGQKAYRSRPMAMREMKAQNQPMMMSADVRGGKSSGGAELAVSRRQIMSATVILTSDSGNGK